MKRLVSCLAAAACLGTTAAAASLAELQLVEPVVEPAQVIIDGRVWSCEADRCISANEGRSQPVPRECKRVVRELGPVKAFRSNGRVLTEQEIANCNG